MPGTWEVNPDTGEKTRFVPARLRLGAGTTTFLEGKLIEDPSTGKETLTSPQVSYRDPVPVDNTVDGAAAAYLAILEEARQSHVLMNSQADISGKSRVEARRDFESSLKPTKLEAEKVGRWLLRAVIALAENFYGSPGQYTEKYRVDFSCIVDMGVATADERQQNTKDVEAGIIPKEYALRAMGIDDTDAAEALINSEPRAQLAVLAKRVAVYKEGVEAGLSAETAATLAGFTEEQIAMIAAGNGFNESDDRGGAVGDN
jgi:hypothetical protein